MLREIDFELKGVGEDGHFEGLCAGYGNIDGVGDKLEPRAFAGDDGKTVPVLWAHKRDEPVGLGTLAESAEGVRISGQLDLDTASGRGAYTRLKKGIVKHLSIGFEVAEHSWQKDVRVIKRGVIREVSLVVFGANPKAQVTAVKDEQPACAARELLPYCD